jgi:hypothetical protein
MVQHLKKQRTTAKYHKNNNVGKNKDWNNFILTISLNYCYIFNSEIELKMLTWQARTMYQIAYYVDSHEDGRMTSKHVVPN